MNVLHDHNQRPTIPDFMIVGAAKSGTTSLYQNLNSHPDVLMATPKEPLFFEDEYERGINYYRSRYFREYSGQSRVGEARVANLFLPFVPARIKQQLPDVKLIAILRNPVDRAYSHWWMKVCAGLERLSFDQAIDDNLQRIESGIDFSGESGEMLWRTRIARNASARVDWRVYVDAGYYARQLKRFFLLFPMDQIKILYFDDLVRYPKQVFAEIAAFLDLDPRGLPTQFTRENAAFSPVSLPLLKLDRTLRLSKWIPKEISGFIKEALIRYKSVPKMNQNSRDRLVEHFHPENEALEKLLGRSFSSWNG